MKIKKILTLIVLTFSTLFCVNQSFAELKPVVVESGLVRGVEENGLAVYRGIPFAAPPIGDLRWKAPQKAASWDGILEAKNFQASCPQAVIPNILSMNSDVGKQSEDCLYLNIWTPAKPDNNEKLPVMVWIHGGGLAQGASFQANFTGENIAKKGVVFVSIAYRLNIFGFLAHPELSAENEHGVSGNYGLLDQIAALQWIHDNISAFGGNPDNVTIFGESAGGISVSMLCASPLAKGLFNRAISQSGGSFGPIEKTRLWGIQDLKSAESFGKNYLEGKGYSSIKDLRKLSAEELEPLGRPNSPLGLFWPVCDNYLITGDPYRLYQDGKYNDVDILIGINSNEGGIFFSEPYSKEEFINYMDIFGDMKSEALKIYPANNDSEALESRRAVFQDTVLGWHTYTWARLQSSTGKSRIYVYYFTQNEPEHDFGPILEGAAHSDEINYVFGHMDWNNNFHYTNDDKKFSEQIMSYWVNFARTGNPNGEGLPEWHIYENDKNSVMYLNGLGSKAGVMPHKERMDFLTKFFEEFIYVHIGQDVLTIKPENNSSAKAFINLLRKNDLTVEMHDYGNFEKVGSIGSNLPRNDKPITTKPGDVILYQGNQITIYYDENSWNFTKLGEVQGLGQTELKSILGDGNVSVRFSLRK